MIKSQESGFSSSLLKIERIYEEKASVNNAWDCACNYRDD